MLPTYLHSITYFNRQGFFAVFKEYPVVWCQFSRYNPSRTQIDLMGFINNIYTVNIYRYKAIGAKGLPIGAKGFPDRG